MKARRPSRHHLIYAALAVVASCALILLVADGSFDRTDVASGLFALFGTFLGALFAFRLEQYRERLREGAAQKAALNRALLVLGYHHNGIRNYRDEMLKYKSEIELAFNFPALQPSDNFDLRQEFEGLTFLLDSKNPQLIFDLLIEQERFDAVLQTIRQRNQFYVEQVQPVFAAKRLNNRAVSRGELETELGDYLFGGALQGASSMREHVDKSNESIPALALRLRATAKELFPHEKFVQFGLVPLKNERAQPPA